MLPQLRRRPAPSFARVQHGAHLIVWGLFLEVVVADNLAEHVDRVFLLAPSGHMTPLQTWLGMVYFGVQVFADFAGYSAIAIGLASLMVLRFPRNFLYPFLARGPTEFWNRWHLTLSTWLRDYLYVPLGGNRKGRARTHVNLMITMVVAGAWHGAAWTVIAWGGLQGVGLCVDRALRGPRPAGWPTDAPRGVRGLTVRALQMLAFQVFLHTGWALFRAPDSRRRAPSSGDSTSRPSRRGWGSTSSETCASSCSSRRSY